MPLHDHRAAGRQRRGGVAARDRKREREIARAEHRDGAERNLLQPQVRARQRRARRLRGIDRRGQKAAVAHDARKQTKLADGARAFALQPRGGQARFRVRALDQCVAERDDLVGDRLEKRRARCERLRAIGVERAAREFARAIDVGLRRDAEGRHVDRRALRRVECVQGAGRADHRVGADQHLSCQLHGCAPWVRVGSNIVAQQIRCLPTPTRFPCRPKPAGDRRAARNCMASTKEIR
ncbi:hypothetical protein FEP76_01259 [Burkholderia multivorans]|nr:hypothetical protein [Burkholderia multivorans]